MIKKILSAALATAMVTVFCAVPTFAGVQTSIDNAWIDGGTLFYDLVAAGYDPASVNGQTVVVSFTADESEGFGGGIMFNSGENGWQQSEDYYWGNEGKALTTSGGDGSYTLTFTVPSGAFTANDLSANEGTWGQICLQQWWGKDMTVTEFKVGNGAPAKATEETTSDDSAAADTDDGNSSTETATSSDDSSSTTTTGTSDSSTASNASESASTTVAKTADVTPVAGIILVICGLSLVAVALKKRSAIQ